MSKTILIFIAAIISFNSLSFERCFLGKTKDGHKLECYYLYKNAVHETKYVASKNKFSNFLEANKFCWDQGMDYSPESYVVMNQAYHSTSVNKAELFGQRPEFISSDLGKAFDNDVISTLIWPAISDKDIEFFRNTTITKFAEKYLSSLSDEKNIERTNANIDEYGPEILLSGYIYILRYSQEDKKSEFNPFSTVSYYEQNGKEKRLSAHSFCKSK